MGDAAISPSISTGLISFRGCLYSADASKENHPKLVLHALRHRVLVDVMVDVWYIAQAKQFYLGTSFPEHPVSLQFLQNRRIWCCARNSAACIELASMAPFVQYFSLTDSLGCALTSNPRYLWARVATPIPTHSDLRVIHEVESTTDALALFRAGSHDVCLRDCVSAAISIRQLRHIDPMQILPRNAIRVIVFDLDGVLVTSKEIHYKAFNMALAEHDPKYIITREMHESKYDGLSTKQKLEHLTTDLGLGPEHYDTIWNRKQAISLELFRTDVKRDNRIRSVLQKIRDMGYPIAVCSNCIRASVYHLLEGIGVLDLVDVYFSNDDVPKAKPAPDIYLTAADHFGVRPSELLICEDNFNGRQAAAISGAHLCKVEEPSDVTLPRIMDRIMDIEESSACRKTLNVLVPMLGRESSLAVGIASGYGTSPILTTVAGKTVLEHIIDTVRVDLPCRFIFVVRKYQSRRLNLPKLLANAVNFEALYLLEIDTESTCAIETCLLAQKYIDTEEPLFIVNSNAYIDVLSTNSQWDTLFDTSADGAILVHRGDTHPTCSYVDLNSNGFVTTIVEKVCISDIATCGYFFWRHGSVFCKHARHCFGHGQKFISSVVAKGLLENMSFSTVEIERWFHFNIPNNFAACISFLESMEPVLKRSYSFHKFGVSSRMLPKNSYSDNMISRYVEMSNRQRLKIATSGWVFDNAVSQPDDTRRCFAAYTLCDSANFVPGRDLITIQAALEDLGAGMVYYCKGQCAGNASGVLHSTFLQIIGFGQEAMSAAGLERDYASVIEECVDKPWTLKFKRLILTPGGILLAGMPGPESSSKELPRALQYRERARLRFKEANLTWGEPYYNDILHATLFRLTRALTEVESEVLVSLVDRYSTGDFGTLNVDGMRVGLASWAMADAQLSKHVFGQVAIKDRVVSRGFSRSMITTHRGLQPSASPPTVESTLGAFSEHISAGYSIEFDVNFCRDAEGKLFPVIWHDSDASRLDDPKGPRGLIDVPSSEFLSFKAVKTSSRGESRPCSLPDILNLIESSSSTTHALHVKSMHQTAERLRILADYLIKFGRAKDKLFCFDLKPDAAAFLKALVPGVRTACSVAHSWDVSRYQGAVGGTLLLVEEAAALADIYDWAWLDEWDTSSESPSTSKKFYTAAVFKHLRTAGFTGIGLVTPELHATSPHLLGGEKHPDACDQETLMARIAEILSLGPDTVCTDYPVEVEAIWKRIYA